MSACVSFASARALRAPRVSQRRPARKVRFPASRSLRRAALIPADVHRRHMRCDDVLGARAQALTPPRPDRRPPRRPLRLRSTQAPRAVSASSEFQAHKGAFLRASVPSLAASVTSSGSKKSTVCASADAVTTGTTAMGDVCELDNFQRVSVLAEALPYLQRFAGQTIVVKYGGAAMTNEGLKKRVIQDLVLLSTVGIRPILVHGGGPEINQWLTKVGIEPVFKKGLRVTDADTMEIVEMVLVGKVNKSLVSLINCAGGRAVGVCGKDGNTLRGKIRDPEWGFVGDVTSVDTSVLRQLSESGCIPVVATVAMDESGQALNVNADTAAGELAASIGAAKLILMTDVPGVCTDKDDASSLIRTLTIAETRDLVASDVIAGGMIPKVECCVKSIAQGVKSAHIIDGRAPHSLLLEILTDEGAGTMISG